MAEVKIGTKGAVDIAGVGPVEWEVTALKTGGVVEITWSNGQTSLVNAVDIAPETMLSLAGLATNNVLGLQPDPPAAIARVARNTSATVLPSPVAPETNKSGIVPDGQVKYLGNDGFLHVVKSASSRRGLVDPETVAVRED